ncbi:hypothetical protein KY308_03725 [Candidatus Woesearchaeota archaeon]|nr:hypothetical protein [Candidatus Woesearchaeota archaeon]
MAKLMDPFAEIEALEKHLEQMERKDFSLSNQIVYDNSRMDILCRNSLVVEGVPADRIGVDFMTNQPKYRHRTKGSEEVADSLSSADMVKNYGRIVSGFLKAFKL